MEHLFKARCSALGDLMSDPKAKADKEAGKLSKTAEMIAENWVKENVFGRCKHIETNQMAKGINMEWKAIETLNKVLGTCYQKDNERLSNDYCTGHRDIDGRDHIRDTKTCYGFSTFPFFGLSVERAYEWQMQGYLYLSGEKYTHAFIDKVLVTSPEWLINSLLQKAWYEVLGQFGIGHFALEDWYMERAKTIFQEHVFDWSEIRPESLFKPQSVHFDYEPSCPTIPMDKRVQSFRIERQDVGGAIEARVKQVRQYINLKGY